MSEPKPPRFQWGQRVVCTADLYNDGSFPEAPEGALLAPAGAEGEIVQHGVHVESGTNVYMVEFNGRHVVGCREDEIVSFDTWRDEAAVTERTP